MPTGLFEPWSKEWRIEKGNGAGGGQGYVRRVSSVRDGKIGALKVIHKDQQNRITQRSRMHREVQALSRLNVIGVPKVLDSNTELFSKTETPLYFVSEWIEGKTLHDNFWSHPTSILHAASITSQLCAIVQACHDNSILHRDIKPQNIIIADTGLVSLVDFGLSWVEPIEGDTNSFVSKPDEELSNRFLRLPELTIGHEKHNAVSDVTYLVGILFFLCTGFYPRSLDDGHGNKPHESFKDSLPQSLLTDENWRLLRRVFNVGFEMSLKSRFQTANSLLQMIDSILVKRTDAPSDSERLRHLQLLQETLNTNDMRAKEKSLKVISDACVSLRRKFEEIVSPYNLTVGYRVDRTENSRELHLYFGNEVHSDKRLEFVCRFELRDDLDKNLVGWYTLGSIVNPQIFFNGYVADEEGLVDSINVLPDELLPTVAEEFLNVTKKMKTKSLF